MGSKWTFASLEFVMCFNSGGVLIVTWDYVIYGFMLDRSGVSYLIIILFLFGLFHSFRNALEVNRELRSAEAA